MSGLIFLVGYAVGCITTSLMIRYKIKKQLKAQAHNMAFINYKRPSNVSFVDVSSDNENNN
jgi:hypothetical protein